MNVQILYYIKKEQFKRFIEGYNIYYKTNIKYLDYNFKPSYKNAWLSGF